MNISGPFIKRPIGTTLLALGMAVCGVICYFLLGVAALLALRFPRWAAWTLLGLFLVQFAIPGQHGRYLLSALYIVLAIGALIRNRRAILPTLAAPFRRTVAAEPVRERELVNAA